MLREWHVMGRTCGRGAAILALLGCFLIAVSSNEGADPPSPTKHKFTNRLAKETSPYLLMHAHNPTDWYPWGPEAFAKAKKEGKLIFLSIGYSSCYWCHVMERESFNNEEVAKLLNKDFVCIKVDREERPDIDHIYMTAIEVMGRHGGWPLSMFLTADAKPFYGGTYWPREDKEIDGETRRGFKTLLTLVAEAHKNATAKVREAADKLAAATVTALETPPTGIGRIDLKRDLVKEVVANLKERFDKQYGGFGKPPLFRGPKFPQPPMLLLLLEEHDRTKTKELLDMLALTLDKMARGGIYDHIGGGFHRYSTERTWTVPHFEKMLYDNAQLVEVYSRAYRITKNPVYRRVIEETLGYIRREMTSPQGAFYSSQDAETHHEEGRSYVWTDAEIDAALPDKADASLFRKFYGADGSPNFEKKFHIFTLPKSFAERAAEMKRTEKEQIERIAPLKKKLFDVRWRRDQPFLNRIALTAWSGLMIAGYAEAGQALAEPKYTDAAARAADFVLKHQRGNDGRLFRTYGAQPGQAPRAAGNAYLEDYSFLVHGLLSLHDATRDKKWLDEACTLTATMLTYYGDKKAGGYYFTANDHERLFARAKDSYDGAIPSGNSVAARNLVRLWRKTGEDRYRAEAEKTLRAFAGTLQENTSGHCALAQALDMFLEGKTGTKR
jgi:uncharacterized protein YyaL (SSP411 family)